jgi:thiamine pyrophosphate-dependent acetolactate synthase large subunit-like protein
MIRAELVLEGLRKHGVSYVVGLPGNSSAALIAVLSGDTPEIPYVCLTREGEAFAIASAIWEGKHRLS